MPLFDFQCPECEEIKEVVRKAGQDAGEEKCSTCSSSMIRIFSVFGVVFNAPGFYKTDN